MSDSASTQSVNYIGRFAPSPTGPLHFGSLVTAVASYLDAKANDGKWLIRMEDLDRPRVEPGAANNILTTLEKFGFEWDDEIIYQSQRDDIYQTYADKLHQQAILYPCGCTRKEVQSLAHAGLEGPVYPGTCRNGLGKGRQARAWRIRVNNKRISFDDQIQGRVSHDLTEEIGDFVLRRADGLFAYQLAVVVDDAKQGITHVVRGADLLNSTTRQIYLQQQLNLVTPYYAHVPLITDSIGNKLSKQNKAPAVSIRDPATTLLTALSLLGFSITDELNDANLIELWRWAISRWSVNNVPAVHTRLIVNDIE